jgi:hypothetical protein
LWRFVDWRLRPRSHDAAPVTGTKSGGAPQGSLGMHTEGHRGILISQNILALPLFFLKSMGVLAILPNEQSLRAPLFETREFAVSHIPAAAGSSFIAEMQRFFPRRYPLQPAGIEICVLQTMSQRQGAVQMVVLRNPRGHLYSQYTECCYDAWFLRHATADFPRSKDGFETWNHHFTAQQERAVASKDRPILIATIHRTCRLGTLRATHPKARTMHHGQSSWNRMFELQERSWTDSI